MLGSTFARNKITASTIACWSAYLRIYTIENHRKLRLIILSEFDLENLLTINDQFKTTAKVYNFTNIFSFSCGNTFSLAETRNLILHSTHRKNISHEVILFKMLISWNLSYSILSSINQQTTDMSAKKNQVKKSAEKLVKEFSSCNIFSPPNKRKNEESALDENANKAGKLDVNVNNDRQWFLCFNSFP